MSTSSLTRPRVAAAWGSVRAHALDAKIAGTLTFLAGSAILMAIITAEAVYPAPYSTGANAISDLGGTEPPNAVVLQPSATIFDVSMLAAGLVVVAAAWFVHRAVGRRVVTIPLLVLGVSAAGVGLFPGDTGTPHALFAMGCFIAGGVAALAAGAVTDGPFRVLSMALGAVTLVTLASYVLLGEASPFMALGLGGLERWIVYPIVIWLIGYGGYLLGTTAGSR